MFENLPDKLIKCVKTTFGTVFGNPKSRFANSKVLGWFYSFHLLWPRTRHPVKQTSRAIREIIPACWLGSS